MMYTNAKWVDYQGQHSLISCDINGVTSFVPLDEANADYQKIMALVAAGELTIAPADPAEG